MGDTEALRWGRSTTASSFQFQDISPRRSRRRGLHFNVRGRCCAKSSGERQSSDSVIGHELLRRYCLCGCSAYHAVPGCRRESDGRELFGLWLGIRAENLHGFLGLLCLKGTSPFKIAFTFQIFIYTLPQYVQFYVEFAKTSESDNTDGTDLL